MEGSCPRRLRFLEGYVREGYLPHPTIDDSETDFTREELIDCYAGINPFGPPEGIERVLREIGPGELGSYPEIDYSVLKRAIIAYWKDYLDLQADEIFPGNGSMGVLERVNKFLFCEGSTVLGFIPQYAFYVGELEAWGARYDAVRLREETGFKFDEAALAEMVENLKSGYDAVYIDNPSNPTGQLIPLDYIEEVLKEAGKHDTAVILDEAYGDFVPPENSAITLLRKYDNAIVVRSFSKGYALPGVRAGYGVCGKKFAEYWRKVEIPVTLNTISSLIAAEALKHHEFIERSRTAISEAKAKLTTWLRRYGYRTGTTDPRTPIILVSAEDPAVDLHRDLMRRGIITTEGREFAPLGRNSVRLRIPADVERLIERLGAAAP